MFCIAELLENITKLILLYNEPDPRSRSCRRLPRNNGWWENVINNYSDARFKEMFRMTKGTFYYILSKIEHRIEKNSVTVEAPIPSDMRLAICLYKLTRGDYHYTISEMTGIGEATVCRIIIDVCETIVEVLWKETVEKFFPKSANDFQESSLQMDIEWQFPFAFSAIDGSHLPIKCPDGGMESKKQYFNVKGFYSIILLAIVDAKYRFIWA